MVADLFEDLMLAEPEKCQRIAPQLINQVERRWASPHTAHIAKLQPPEHLELMRIEELSVLDLVQHCQGILSPRWY